MTKRIFAAAVVVLSGTIATVTASGRGGWTSAQLDELQSMSLTELRTLPAIPTNRVAADPRAADLGRRLFFDTRLSSNGRVACSTCHQPDRGLQDGTPLTTGVGTTARRRRRSSAWRVRRFCSGMVAKIVYGPRHSVRWRIRLSTAARAHSTRTWSSSPTVGSTSSSSERCQIFLGYLDLDHYNRAPAAPVGHSELRPLRLRASELRHIEAFLRTLTGSL